MKQKANEATKELVSNIFNDSRQQPVQGEADYYAEQLSRVNVGETEYSPTIKVFANGNGQDTKHLSLNYESATVLINWLRTNFLSRKYKS